MLADVSGWGIFWDFLWFFFLFLWIVLLFHILGDLFRDHETSGWAKAIWCIFLIFMPFLTVFVYLIARGSGMAKRSIAAQQQAQAQFDDYVRSAAGTGSPADQISKAKELLDAGTITQADFDALKAKALAG
jgi:hypothetical protein